MKHFDAEEIARFAEGNVKGPEQETFIRHLAECGECFKAYTDTLKFIEEEYEKRFTLKRLKFPVTEKIKTAAHGFRQGLGRLFKDRRLVLAPVLTMLVVVALLVPYFLKTPHNGKILKAQIDRVASDIESIGSQSLAPAGAGIYAAVRTGIFVEDLTLLVNSGRHKELQMKITNLLHRELKVFAQGEHPIPENLATLSRKNFKEVIGSIEELLEYRSLLPLYRFGRFVEHGLLSAFAKKKTSPEEIEEFRRILENYQDQLPQGVFRGFDRLGTTPDVNNCKEIYGAIKEIFLSSN